LSYDSDSYDMSYDMSLVSYDLRSSAN